jgi:hypothetical protein
MKYIPVIFVCLLACACHKSDNRMATNGTRLTSITSDSAGIISFGYSNNLITSITERYPNRMAPDGSSVVYYTNPVSNHLISVGSPGNSFNYKLNSSDLPLLISDSYIDSGGIVHESNVAEFIYLPNTDILDSVNKFYSDTLNFVYKFEYSGENISKITEWLKTPTMYLSLATFEYSYDTTANVFRQTDLLLYIYNYPNTAILGQTIVAGAFFAETFSKSTFKSMVTSELPSGEIPFNSYKIRCDVNSKGKITSETLDNGMYVYTKKYEYE